MHKYFLLVNLSKIKYNIFCFKSNHITYNCIYFKLLLRLCNKLLKFLKYYLKFLKDVFIFELFLSVDDIKLYMLVGWEP